MLHHPLFESYFLPFIWAILFFFIFCPSPPRLPLILSDFSFHGFSSWTETSEVLFTVQMSTCRTPGLIRLFFCSFFIMDGDFWGSSYCLDLFLCIECGDVKLATYLNAEAVVESLGTFKGLSCRSLVFLLLISLARIDLGGDLCMLPRWMLGVTEDPRFCVHWLRNGLAIVGLIPITWADILVGPSVYIYYN